MPDMALGFTPSNVLRGLFQLRCIAVITQLAVLAYAQTQLHMALPLKPLLILVSGLALWNVLVWWRLRPTLVQRWLPTTIEASFHLLIDIGVLTGLLYWAGGPTNPFVSLYLVPIAIAATVLPVRLAWLVTAISIGAYSMLLWQHVPLPHAHGNMHSNDDFNLHVIGMWANFILSALLIAAFVTLLATAIRRRDQALIEQREQALRTEQLLALGTQAAGTAHELNTPLSTMAILVDELKHSQASSVDISEDLQILSEQIGHCRDRIRELVDNSSLTSGGESVSATELLNDVIHRWSLLRPETRIQSSIAPGLENVCLSSDPTLVQALINLLVNAADASEEQAQDVIELEAVIVATKNRFLELRIDDHGPGLTQQQQQLAGQAFFTTKPEQGLGMGLVLSNSTLERLGGRVTLENCTTGGTRATVWIPVTDKPDV